MSWGYGNAFISKFESHCFSRALSCWNHFLNFLLNQIKIWNFSALYCYTVALLSPPWALTGFLNSLRLCITIQKVVPTVALTVVDTKAKWVISSYMLMCIYKFKDSMTLSTSIIIQIGSFTEKSFYKTVSLLSCKLLEMSSMPEGTIHIKLTLR